MVDSSSQDSDARLAIYRHFAATGKAPPTAELAARLGCDVGELLAIYRRLRRQRLLLLGDDGESIRMAPPFSGVPTQHVVEAGAIRYFANCAWDALGIPAALRRTATVRSRCEQTHEPLVLEVGSDGPESTDWLFHCLVPAAAWWDDLVFT